MNLKKGEGGLTKNSAIMIDQIRAIDNRRFIQKIGQLPPEVLAKVEENIRLVLDLN